MPELAGRVQAVAVRRGDPVVGTQLRWSAPKLVATANERVSGANVPALHVLAPAPVRPSRHGGR
ncbi:hypothetical protein LUR56_01610 [Streptomyces sp. MT29]|nr:hypothetical protein [Streptomyces sp. MT29]